MSGLVHADDNNDVFGIANIPAAKRIRNVSPPSIYTDPAPHVLQQDPLNHSSLVTRPTDTQINVNIPYNDMVLPIQGPDNPFADRNRFLNQNALAGHVEEQAMSDHAFKAQHLTHAILGYSANPSVDPNAPAILGSLASAQQNGFATIDAVRPTNTQKRALKRKRKDKGSLDVVDGDGAYLGPWAAWDGEEQAAFLDGVEEEETGDHPEQDDEPELPVVKKKAKPKRGGLGQETSVFHGKSMTDYQGRTYMHPPLADAPHLSNEAGSQETFIPKACIHTWTGHTQGVSVIRLFPDTGHLLLSGSMDTKIKLWDVYTHGNCLRTFHGHVQAVKDVTFSNDGTRFLSCGYDRQMKLWDTETGQCIKRFSNGKTPYVVRFHPDDDKQHIFLAGMSDKKIIQYDINSGEITQEYDQHLGPVNTITFVDENRRFVTTSDDKTIRAWDYDIPVVIKYIAEPHMHSMPAVTIHPSKKYFAAQSLDNQILVYSTDNFRQNRKKRFAGHSVAGYACQVGFSPDGKWISSGDSEGNVVFWDWKSGRIKSRLNAHSKVVIAHEWLPHETSKVVTASWDGLIKLWTRHESCGSDVVDPDVIDSKYRMAGHLRVLDRRRNTGTQRLARPQTRGGAWSVMRKVQLFLCTVG
ncbi:WD40-repeat-containing domain protein [Boletus edulis]|nr:WD40-repeat-containing domain protein [Boletus edulis]